MAIAYHSTSVCSSFECVVKSALTMGYSTGYRGVCTFLLDCQRYLEWKRNGCYCFSLPFSQLGVNEPPEGGCGDGRPGEFGAKLARQSIVAPAQLPKSFEHIVDACLPSHSHIARRDRFWRTCRDDNGNAVTSRYVVHDQCSERIFPSYPTPDW